MVMVKPATIDGYVLNNVAHGTIAQKLLATDGNPCVLRPYVGDDGRTNYIDVPVKNKDGTQGWKAQRVQNAAAVLRRDEWDLFDKAVTQNAKPPMKAVNDLRQAGLVYNLPNGWANTTLQWSTISGINPAQMSMSGRIQQRRDQVHYEMDGIPLPIISYGFELDARFLAITRKTGAPLDTTMAELAGEQVGILAEKLLLGVESWGSFAGFSLVGYTSHADRMLKSLTSPATADPMTVVHEVIAMVQQAQDNYHYGPFWLYYSPGYSQYLSRDYASSTYYGTGTATGRTVKERILQIDQITKCEMLSYLPDHTLLLVEPKQRTVRLVIGMEVTTLQWETDGGMGINFLVMAIILPNIRSDNNDKMGLLHGSV
jgi:hypothetical protein